MAKKTKKDIDAEIAELEAIEASLESDEAEVSHVTESGEGGQEPVSADPSQPDTDTVVEEVEEKLPNTVPTESGSRIVVKPGQERAFRVQDAAGSWYEHCKDAADGEWVYRPVA